jgi:PAS domain S-box-containing protein
MADMISGLFTNSNYHFNIYALPMFGTAQFILFLGLSSFLQDTSSISKSFNCLTTSAAIWQSGMGLIYLLSDPGLILPFYKGFTFLGVVTLAPGIYLLTVTTLGQLQRKKRQVILFYMIAFGFYAAGLATDTLVTGVNLFFWGNYVSYGPLAIPFLFFFCTLIIHSLWLLVHSIHQTEWGIRRNQYKLLLISLAIALTGVVDFITKCFPHLVVYPFGYLPVLCFLVLQAYAIQRYQKASLSDIFRALEDGVFVTNRQHRIVEMNVAAERITGLGRTNLLGRSTEEALSLIRDRLPDSDPVCHLLAHVHEQVDSFMEEDISLIKPDIQLNVICSPMTDRFGLCSGLVITLKNITARKRMEQELRLYKDQLEELVAQRTLELQNSEATYRALVSHAQVGIGIHQNYRMTFINDRLATMLGYPESELIGLSIRQLIHPDERRLIIDRAADRYSGKEPTDTYDIRLIRKDGSSFPALISNASVTFQGEQATLITIVDTTDSRLRRELEMANQELEHFAYSLSHDLRAPLRSIDGFSQALFEDCSDQLSPEGTDYLNRIRAASRRMTALIDAMLQLSRLNRYELKREETDLTVLAQEVAAELKAAAPDRRVEFVIEEKMTAIGDPVLLRAILENLLGNAFKFTQKHDRATIEMGQLTMDRRMVYYIRDDGAGFDMARTGNLFTPFQRLHRDADFSGTGVGLASARRMINRHGGEIWAEGAVEKGATFYFTLE